MYVCMHIYVYNLEFVAYRPDIALIWTLLSFHSPPEAPFDLQRGHAAARFWRAMVCRRPQLEACHFRHETSSHNDFGDPLHCPKGSKVRKHRVSTLSALGIAIVALGSILHMLGTGTVKSGALECAHKPREVRCPSSALAGDTVDS